MRHFQGIMGGVRLYDNDDDWLDVMLVPSVNEEEEFYVTLTLMADTGPIVLASFKVNAVPEEE